MTSKLKPIVREYADKQRIERGHYRTGDDKLKFKELTRGMTPMELEIFWESHNTNKYRWRKKNRG